MVKFEELQKGDIIYRGSFLFKILSIDKEYIELENLGNYTILGYDRHKVEHSFKTKLETQKDKIKHLERSIQKNEEIVKEYQIALSKIQNILRKENFTGNYLYHYNFPLNEISKLEISKETEHGFFLKSIWPCSYINKINVLGDEYAKSYEDFKFGFNRKISDLEELILKDKQEIEKTINRINQEKENESFYKMSGKV